MSKATNWAADQRVGAGTPKAILLLIAKHATSDNWVAWPKLETLARGAEVSKRTVQRILDRLKAAGLIYVEHCFKADGSQTSSRLWLLRDGEFVHTRKAETRFDFPLPCDVPTLFDAPPVTPERRPPGDTTVASPYELPVEPPLEPQEEPHTPDAVATGPSALNSCDDVKAPYLQSRKAANQAWFELHQMPFPRFAIGEDFELNDRSDRGAAFHWLRLLRSGHSAADILTAAQSYLRDCPKQQRPSVGGFLARFENYTEEDDRPDIVIAGPQTMFDLANELEQQLRAREELQVVA